MLDPQPTLQGHRLVKLNPDKSRWQGYILERPARLRVAQTHRLSIDRNARLLFLGTKTEAERIPNRKSVQSEKPKYWPGTNRQIENASGKTENTDERHNDGKGARAEGRIRGQHRVHIEYVF